MVLPRTISQFRITGTGGKYSQNIHENELE